MAQQPQPIPRAHTSVIVAFSRSIAFRLWLEFSGNEFSTFSTYEGFQHQGSETVGLPLNPSAGFGDNPRLRQLPPNLGVVFPFSILVYVFSNFWLCCVLLVLIMV